MSQLKIAKPTLLRKPHQPHTEKDNWRAMDRTREEDEEDLNDWTADTGKSFFVVKKLPMSARKESTPQSTESTDPRWAGRPNFKKFRPVRWRERSIAHSDFWGNRKTSNELLVLLAALWSWSP
jgi:hypothetical protein